MMNAQRLRLPILVIACAWIAVQSVIAADKTDTEAPKPKVQILASPAVLPKGAKCLLTMRPMNDGNGSEHSTFFEGKIIEASSKGIRLATTLKGGRTVTSTPVLSEIPFLRRYFITTGVGVEPLDQTEKVWFPVEEIGSIEMIEHSVRGIAAGAHADE